MQIQVAVLQVKTCRVKGAQYIVAMYLLMTAMTAYHSVLTASLTSGGILSPKFCHFHETFIVYSSSFFDWLLAASRSTSTTWLLRVPSA